MAIEMSATRLLSLLQLASPTLPVGAYSYSEGLEALIEQGTISTGQSLAGWLIQELALGSIRLEAAVMLRAYRLVQAEDWMGVVGWNDWLSAARETEELRQQSWQMGNSLIRLLQDLQSGWLSAVKHWPTPCNFAIAFGLAAAHWQIPQEAAALGYLSSWATNIVSAGVRLVPLGQTQGQQIVLELHPHLAETAQSVLTLSDDQLTSCSWGLALASMVHETQYSRLFRS